MRVDQYVTGFAPHDAVSNHTLLLRKALRDAGYESHIWAEQVHGPLVHEAKPFTEDHRRDGGRALVYQCSTGGSLAPWLAARADAGEKLSLQYHNITPAWYFERWDRDAARESAEGRRQLAMLSSRTYVAIGISAYNEDELRSIGYPRTASCPLLVDLEQFHRPPREKTLERLHKQGGNRPRGGAGALWLFVGRIAPNKCQHDLIAAFAAYRHLFDPSARLALVGQATQPRYRWALERLAHELDLGESLEMTGPLDDGDLLAYWGAADVFVCLSEHEGFCAPLVEAMELGVPVVAFAAGAVPETLGWAGALLDEKSPGTVANAVAAALEEKRRRQLVEAGRTRAADFALNRTAGALVQALSSAFQ